MCPSRTALLLLIQSRPTGDRYTLYYVDPSGGGCSLSYQFSADTVAYYFVLIAVVISTCGTRTCIEPAHLGLSTPGRHVSIEEALRRYAVNSRREPAP